MPAMQSADLPVRPFGAEPAAPASAVGAPPDAPAATPARALLAFCSVLLLCSAVPVAASKCIDKSRHRHVCPVKEQVAAVMPVRKAPAPSTIVLRCAGGGASTHWMRIASDLMP